MSKIRAGLDSKDAQFELDRLSKGLDAKTRRRMAGDFEQLWQQTQRAVHVISGALKASGHHAVRDSSTRWRGVITYGGPTTVKRRNQRKNPYFVDYAALENDKKGRRATAPGTPHHFFDQDMVDRAMDRIEQDVADWLTEEKRENRSAKFKGGKGRRR